MLRSLSIKLSFQAVSLISLVVFKIPVSLMLSCFSTVCQMCIFFFYPVFILMTHFFTYGNLLSFHMLNLLLPHHPYSLLLSWKTCSACSPYLPDFFTVLLYFHIFFISLHLCASFWMIPSMSLILWCLGLCYLSQN